MKNIAFTKVIRSAALLLLLLFLADRTIAYLITDMYSNGKNGDFYQTTYAVRSAREDVLIFGSSRATHHYKSEEFERKLGMSTYNLGRDGRNILYSHTIFSNILECHKPRVVILDVQPAEFTWKAGKEGEDAMVSALLPYVDVPSINKSIWRIRQSDIILSRIFKTYPYNSNLLQILGYHFGVMKGEETIKGYIPLQGSKISARTHHETQKTEVVQDTNLVNTFKRFIALTKANGIDLYVIVSPTTSDDKSSLPLLKQITKEAGVRFNDFSNSSSFSSTQLFYDPTHLNDQGAKLFTDLVISELTRSGIASTSRLAVINEEEKIPGR